MTPIPNPRLTAVAVVAGMLSHGAASARQWVFKGQEPVEAEYVGMANGYVLLRGENGTGAELPLKNFSPADQKFIALLNSDEEKPPLTDPGKPLATSRDFSAKEAEALTGTFIMPKAGEEIRISGDGDPLLGSSVNFAHPSGWVFLDQFKPSQAAKFLNRMLVNGAPAELDKNVRVARHGPGSVIIPHGPDFPALTLFAEENLSGEDLPLKTYQKYGSKELGDMAFSASSFVLKRGYMATLAQNEDGTGFSKNYVAQDHDVVIKQLPSELQDNVSFVRIFPWQWTSKKGIAGGIHQGLNLGWFYDWNIGARSSPDLEYVAIKQKHGWPSMNQDWRYKGINHLLGFNEPDRPDQANMTVETAIRLWPELLGTGLRLGSPATSDGGLGWLYKFMEEADKQGLRVDFVAVHYYRAHNNPGDDKGAAGQFYNFLKNIHDRTGRPLWVTEWNNGANWTSAPDPNERQQKAAIEEMIKMLDETPFVERYALYNWVEPVRELKRKDGSLTPAGEAYRDQVSPVFFQQPRY